MASSKDLVKNVIIYSIGSIGSKLITFLLVPIYTFFLTKAEMGYYDLVISTISLFVPLITIQISDATFRWLIEVKHDSILQSKIITNALVVILAGITIAFTLFSITLLFFDIENKFVISLILFLSALLPLFQQIIRGLEKNKLYSIMGIINTLLIFSLNIIFIMFYEVSVNILLLATAIANIITLILIFRLLNLKEHISISDIDFKQILEMITYSLPLIPNAVSWWLISTANRYIILIYLGKEANGIYALANKFPSIILIVNSVFLLAIQDQTVKSVYNRETKSYFSHIFNRFMVMELSFVLMLITITKFIVSISIDKEFYSSWQYMPFLYLGVAFSAFASFLGTGYLREKKTRGLFTSTLIGGVVSITVSYYYIKSFGLFAPAFGTFLGYFVTWILRIYESKSFFKIIFNVKIFTVMMMLSALFMWLLLKSSLKIDILLCLTALIIAFICNRESVKIIFGKLQLINNARKYRKY
ncbi:oligosaccharide flippase family protein [Pontibacter sp. CAU 1760]